MLLPPLGGLELLTVRWTGGRADPVQRDLSAAMPGTTLVGDITSPELAGLCLPLPTWVLAGGPFSGTVNVGAGLATRHRSGMSVIGHALGRTDGLEHVFAISVLPMPTAR